jgi:nitrogenase molybdenum-iron protein NifN
VAGAPRRARRRGVPSGASSPVNDLAIGEDEPAPKPMTPAQPEILKRAKALSVSPLKASATLGAALAFLGFRRAIPMLHGSQGCTAFGKVFFVRHFREPIPLQTTAIEQVSAIMGSEDHLVEGLRVICEKNAPELIGVPTTGLVETQGCDIRMAVKNFRSQYPQYARIAVVPVATPDFTGSLESGYALATQAIIEWLVPSQEATGTQAGQPSPPTPLLAGGEGHAAAASQRTGGVHTSPPAIWSTSRR